MMCISYQVDIVSASHEVVIGTALQERSSKRREVTFYNSGSFDLLDHWDSWLH